MTGNRGFDDELRTWLEQDGPQDVPERVVDMALEEAAASRRVRPLPGFVSSALDGVAILQQGRQARAAWAWTTIAVLLLTLVTAGLIIAGVILYNGERGARNGPIAFDLGGDIWIVEPVGVTSPVRLTETPGIEEGNPVWSPDGSRLAYWVTEGPSSEIHITDPGGGRRVVLKAPDGLFLPLSKGIFGWSPNGQQIAAPARGSVLVDGGTRLNVETVLIFDVEERSAERVPLDLPGWSFGWSPDGSRLGLVGESDLFLYEPDTGSITSLSDERPPENLQDPYWLRDAPPRFSTDSTTIFYTAGPSIEGNVATTRDGRSDQDIHAMSVIGGRSSVVVNGETNDLAAVLAPDGTRVAFGRSQALTMRGAFDFKGKLRAEISDLSADLLVADADGGEAAKVAEGVWPTAQWSPNSTRLVAKSFDGSELLIIDPDLETPDEVIRIPAPLDEAVIGGFSWGARPPP